MSEGPNTPGGRPNKSWLLSELGQRAIEVAKNPALVYRERSPRIEPLEPETKKDDENVETIRDYSLPEIDASLLHASDAPQKRQRPYISRTPSRVSEYSEFDLTSYDSSIFDPRELKEMDPVQPGTSKGTETTYLRDHANTSMDDVTVIEKCANEEKLHMREIIDYMRDLRIQLNNLQEQFHSQLQDQQKELRSAMRLTTNVTELADEQDARVSPRQNNADVSYGRGMSDVRNRILPTHSYMQLKEARALIPEIDGTSQDKIEEFLSASTYAMESISPLIFKGENNVNDTTKIGGIISILPVWDSTAAIP